MKRRDDEPPCDAASSSSSVPPTEVSTVSVQNDRRDDARPIRCLIAKVGLDGHDRGAHVISRAFRDAGFEVIYSGLHNAPEEIVGAAVQEDVDVLGVSILSGAHNTLIPEIIDGLREYGAFEDTLVLVGGTIPTEDEADLKSAGVAEVFGPGTPIEETIAFVREHARDQ